MKNLKHVDEPPTKMDNDIDYWDWD